jgi:AraC family transcriptional regulator
MNPVTRAVWFIESHYAKEIELGDVAEVAGVSRYHLSRAFGLATGSSVMHYVRRRRLAEAARVLAGGAPDILAVALDAGYGSHEAFTRAFRDHFGVTPEAVRAMGSVERIQLTEPIMMNETLLENLAPPRIVDSKTMLIVGISERYNQEASAKIPAQWQRFVPYLGHIPGQVGRATYGVLCNGDDAGNMDYICGVEVSDFARVPNEFARLRIPEQRYAVFFHDGHISTIRQVWNTIWNKWLPESGYKTTAGPEFERYDERFNPATGEGGFEIWIPVKK